MLFRLPAAVWFVINLAFVQGFGIAPPITRTNRRQSQPTPSHLLSSKSSETVKWQEEVDVIVIGSGIGGLSCAALASKYGFDTLCLEAHDTPGGCAHSFTRYSSASKDVPFRFDSGPSLISGM